MIQEQDDHMWQQKLRLLRWVVFLVPTLIAGIVTYGYLRFEADRFIPPEGYVFPREPALKGEYRFEVLPGRRHFKSSVGGVPIYCRTFSYYDGTWWQSAADSHCRWEELSGKSMEVHRVRVPKKNQEDGPLVVNVISDGKVLVALSDSEIRSRWIRDTNADAVGSGFLLLVIIVGASSFWLAGYVTKKLNERRKI